MSATTIPLSNIPVPPLDFLDGIPEPDPYSAIPQALKALPNWVVWRREERDSKITKVPYNPLNGAHAKANDPTTWTAFNRAVEAMTSSGYDGIGFELGGTDIVGLDFDNAIVDGTIDPYVLQILWLLGNPYTEVSPSGKGLHAFVHCESIPEGGRKMSQGHSGIEIYHGREGGRYFTITGQRVLGEGVPPVADISLPYLLITQNRDKKFRALWLGDTSAHDADNSSADFALLVRLARLTQNDPALMERFFGMSGLGAREKWIDRADYRERTINAAIDAVRKESKTTGPEQNVTEVKSYTADQFVPKRIKWLWPRRFAQKLNLIVGNPDVGKGLISYYTAACVTTGRDFFDEKNLLPASEVVVMAGEDDWDDTVVPRLLSAKADLSKVHHLVIEVTASDGTKAEREPDLSQDIPKLEGFLEKHPNVRLVVIDPVSNYLGNVKMIDEQRVRAVLTPLKDLANRRGVAIVGVMHLNKKVELDAIHRIGGAMAFVGVARMVWLCAPKPAEDGTESDESVMVKIKGNIVQKNLKGLSYKTDVHYLPIEGEDEPVPYVAWVGEVDHQANELTSNKRQNPAHRPAEQRFECEIWLGQALKDGAVELGDLESDGKALHGFSPSTIERARKALGVITFEMGKRKAKDGKQRKYFGCRLPAEFNGRQQAHCEEILLTSDER